MKVLRHIMVIAVLTGFCPGAIAETVSRNVPLTTEITRIYLNGSNELHLSQGEEEFVKLTAPEELLPRIEARVKGKGLYLGREEGPWNDRSWTGFDLVTPVRFDVQLKTIDAIRVWGSGNATISELESDHLRIIIFGSGNVVSHGIRANKVNVEIGGSGEFEGDYIESSKVDLEINGSAKVELARSVTRSVNIEINGAADMKLSDLTSEELDVEINGTADLDLKGNVSSQELEVNGSGGYTAPDLLCDNAYIEIRGQGDVEVNVQRQLRAELNRGAELVYYGNPELDLDISGYGKYRNAGNNRRN